MSLLNRLKQTQVKKDLVTSQVLDTVQCSMSSYEAHFESKPQDNNETLSHHQSDDFETRVSFVASLAGVQISNNST